MRAPANAELPPAPSADESSPFRRSHAVARLRVLVVDDDQHVCEYLRELLEPDGCGVHAIHDPIAALAHAQESEPYHIVILDLKMPGLTGLRFLERLRKVDKESAVIILTGFPSLETATNAIDLDISAYMKKPVSGEDLRDTIARVVRKKGIVVRPEDQLHVAIGGRIGQLRKDRSLTLKEMGRRTSLSVSLLSQIERAESSASISSLYRIATAFDLRLVDLFSEF